MNFNFITSILISWAKNKKLIKKVYIYGSRVRSNYDANSDLDIAVEIDEKELNLHYSNCLAIWFANKEKWTKEIQEIIPYKIHLEWHHPEMTVTVNKGIIKSNVLVYEKET